MRSLLLLRYPEAPLPHARHQLLNEGVHVLKQGLVGLERVVQVAGACRHSQVPARIGGSRVGNGCMTGYVQNGEADTRAGLLRVPVACALMSRLARSLNN
jgi:hypothetical protein